MEIILRGYLVPISPLARECLLRAYGSKLTIDEFEKQFGIIIRHLTPPSRGFYIERLLITLISLKKLCQVQIEHFDSSGFKAKIKFVFENFQRVFFGGYFTPPSDPGTQLGNTLFVPEIFNYPGFDFVYYDSKQDTALFFNVTIKKKCVQHVIQNDINIQSGETKAGILPPAMKVR